MRLWPKAALAGVCALLVVIAGCGGGDGVAEDATVTVYATSPACAGARSELARSGGRAGSVRVRVACLEGVRNGDRLSLAAVGANARRATEDSTAVAYIGEPGAAARFSRPILESASIVRLSSHSGSAAMAKLLRALSKAGDARSLREAVREELESAPGVGR